MVGHWVVSRVHVFIYNECLGRSMLLSFLPVTAGHIYVPSIKKCLTVPSSASPEPIGLTVAACELTDDSRQTFQNFTDKDGNVNWVGGYVCRSCRQGEVVS